MFRFSAPLFFLTNDIQPAYFLRSFVYLFVLFGLIAHQFLFSSFIEPDLSVFGYSLCFFFLFFESLFVFLDREKQKYFDFFLFFLSALFLVSLTVLMGGAGFLFFIFFLIFLQVFPLLLFGKSLLAFVFLLYLSFLFPIVFSLQVSGTYEERLSLTVLTHAVLLSIFIFSVLFCFFLSLSQSKSLTASTSKFTDSNLKISSDLLLSLKLSKKLKLFLNSLVKNFFEGESQKKSQTFSQYGKELQNLKRFITSFIEFAEWDKRLLSPEVIDIKQILNESLSELKGHKQRPDNLEMDLEDFDSFKIEGSALHLKKCFENILVNSFEALQNEGKPTIKIYCLRQKSWLTLHFLDNGHGIEEEDRLFEPLFSKRFGLRGLGLSYVQKVIQAHFGEVKIERVNQWTKVLIKMPLIPAYYDRFDFLKLLKNRKKVA